MATRIGVDNLWAFPLLTDNDAGVTYGEPFRIAKAIEITINPQVQEASLYADDSLAEYYSAVTAYDVTLNIDDLTPEIRGKLLGYEPDENGMIIQTNEITSPAVAIAFRSRRSDGSFEYRNQYKVRFNPTEDTYQTQGESVNFQTPTITGRAMALEHDGSYGAYVVSTPENSALTDAWFTDVQGGFTPAAPGV